MVEKLHTAYSSRYGTPIIKLVETEIFTKQYYTHCMACGFCRDRCCIHGVDVDMNNVERILEFADELEKLVGLTRDTWFQNPIIDDTDFPGGFYCETNVVDGACVFLNTKGRGCQLHAFALKKDLDYHNLKPLVSALFPVSFHNGLLRPSDDVDDGTLICLDSGPSLYRGARTELLYYFGSDLITELDRLESKIVVPRSPK